MIVNIDNSAIRFKLNTIKGTCLDRKKAAFFFNCWFKLYLSQSSLKRYLNQIPQRMPINSD